MLVYFPLIIFLLIIEIKCEFYGVKSNVINLDSSNFNEYIGKNDYDVNIIEFYAPWCGHCQKLKPEYIRLAKETKGIINVYAVNADEDKNKQLAAQFGVQGFPTLVTIVGNNDPVPYQQERSAKAMKRYLYDLLPNHVKKVSEKSLSKFLNKNSDKYPRALLITKKKVTSPLLKKLSSLVKGHIVIAETSSKSSKAIGKKYGINIKDSSKLLVFPKGEKENPTAFNGNSKSFRELQSFLYSFTDGKLEIEEDALDKLLDESCFQEKCVKKGLCVILIRGENKEDSDKNHNILKEIQETNDDASLFAFSQIDLSTNYEWINSIFGDMDSYYSNIIIFAPIKRRYAQYVGSYNTRSISGFISGILRGTTRTAPVKIGKDEELPKLSTETELCKPKPKPKAKPKAKSKPQSKPQTKYGKNDWKRAQPGGGSAFITHLTPQNFVETIVQNTQPAIIEFYAPWCGHCQKLAPEYAKAANHLQGMVIFGGVDCDKDSNKQFCGQFGIKGFPTLKTFPVGIERKQKQGPKDYQGARTAKAIESAAVGLLYSVKIPSLVNSDDYNEFINDNNNSGKLLLFTKKRKPPTMLRALSAKFNDISFAYISKNTKKVNNLLKQLNVNEFPSIYIYNKNNINPLLYKGKKGFIQLDEFVNNLINGNIDETKVEQLNTNTSDDEMCTNKEECSQDKSEL